MSIEVQMEDFSASGHLTTAGMHIFWSEVIKAITKLDTNQISLKPHNNQNKVPALNDALNQHKKLPTPPKLLKRDGKRDGNQVKCESSHTSRSRSRSCRKHRHRSSQEWRKDCECSGHHTRSLERRHHDNHGSHWNRGRNRHHNLKHYHWLLIV